MAGKVLQPLARFVSTGHANAAAKRPFERSSWEQSSISLHEATQRPWLFAMLTALFAGGWAGWGVVIATPADPFLLCLIGAVAAVGGVLFLSVVLRVAFWVTAIPRQRKEIRAFIRKATDEEAQLKQRREEYYLTTLYRLREELNFFDQKRQEAMQYGADWAGQGWVMYGGAYSGDTTVDGLAQRNNELFTALKPVYRTAGLLFRMAGTMSSVSWKTMRTPFPVEPFVLFGQLEQEIAEARTVLDSAIDRAVPPP